MNEYGIPDEQLEKLAKEVGAVQFLKHHPLEMDCTIYRFHFPHHPEEYRIANIVISGREAAMQNAGGLAALLRSRLRTELEKLPKG